MSRPPLVWAVIGLTFFALAIKFPMCLMAARALEREHPAMSWLLYGMALCLLSFFILLWLMSKWWILPMGMAYGVDVRHMVTNQEFETLPLIMPVLTSALLLMHWNSFTWKPQWSRITSS